MKQLMIAFVMLASKALLAQAEEVKNYTWDAVPNFREIPESFKSYPAVVLKDYRLFENKIGQYTYKAYVVKHCAIKILSDEGINNFNKVSIDKKYVRDYRDLQARVIKPDGKIQILSKERIVEKEGSDERLFAFEGVEKGDIIEYFYVIKDFPEFSGVEYFQRPIPVMDGKFQLNNISAGTTYVAAYNGMFNASTKKHNIYSVKDLAAYKEEGAATNLANVAKVYYFLDTNAHYDFTSYYWSLNSYAEGVKAKSMIKDFIAAQGLADTSIPLDDRLKKMDIYLKENLEVDDQINYKTIFTDKKIAPRMVLYLYKDVLDYLKVPYQFVASTDRFDDKFDASRVVPATLSEIAIYIPETKKYIMPFYYYMPYGPPSSVCLGNDAVFYKFQEKKLSHSFDKIGGVSMDDNVNRTESTIDIDSDMETVSVKKRSYFTGYRSYYYRSVLKYITEDKMNDFVKDVTFEDVDVEVRKYAFENKEYRNNYDPAKPFTFDTDVKVKEAWLENAGKNYLITLGKVLGDQTNLYQETERINPIDIAYPRKFVHTITLNIPDGYTVNDVKNLFFNKELKDSENKVIGKFASTASVDGRKVSVSIEEFYNFTHLEKEKYGEYREIINAAYDFYKSALVLVKA